MYVRQAFASVRKCSRVSESVAHRRESQIVAKRRTVVAFELVLRLRVSNVSTVTGIGGVVVARRRTVVTFCTRLVSARLKSGNSHKGSGGSWSRDAELSFLLDSSCVFASQKCQQSQGSGGSWSRNAELSSLLDSSCVLGIGGVVVSRRRTVVTFCTRLVSSRLKSGNSHKGSGGSWSRDAELSSLLALPLERGEERGERRGEKREMRGEKRGEMREERREEREERREKRRERREERREQIGEERSEERGGRREERREERRERLGDRGEGRREKRGEKR